MPSKSPSQKRLMQAAAHTKGGFGGVPQKVGKEFVKADKGLKEGGLYANIHAKRERIAEGSGEKMRRVGSEGAPTAKAFKQSARTAKMKDGGVSLSIGRGEKLPAKQGAGLMAKGRAKYNRETGSNLKAPQPQGGSRRDSFCARMAPVAEKSEKGSRARASMQRWNCPGW
jgi:hypothetical protein